MKTATTQLVHFTRRQFVCGLPDDGAPYRAGEATKLSLLTLGGSWQTLRRC